MKITIINGTNRINNKSINISKYLFNICLSHNFETSLITLENFTTLFNGEFINKDNADSEQLKDITAIQDSNILIYVVPTYHGGIPSPLKNFLDILHTRDIYNNKIIGIISSNSNHKDSGARQTEQILNGILAFQKNKSFITPIIPIIDFENIDHSRIENFIEYLVSFK